MEKIEAGNEVKPSLWIGVRVVMLTCVVREGPTEKGTSVQRAHGDGVGSNHCGYLLKERSWQKEKQKPKPGAAFQTEENANAKACGWRGEEVSAGGMKRAIGTEVREVMEITQGPVGHFMAFPPRTTACLRVLLRNNTISGRYIKNTLWGAWEKQGSQLRDNCNNPGKS